MNECYWCLKELDANTAPEHIIKASFGGSLTSNKILCNTHNNYLGSTIDQKISMELDYLYDSLSSTSNSTKKIKMYKADGTPVLFGVGLKPLPFLKFKIKGKEKIEYFDSWEEMRAKGAILKEQLTKRGEKWEYVEVENPELKSLYFFHPDRKKKFGSEDFYLSFLKIAISFYFHKKGERQFVEYPISVLKKEVEDKNICKFYYSSLYQPSLQEGEVFHLIYLKGDIQQKLLYCYIELFSTHKMLVFLNNDYKGKEIEEEYCYDLINKKRITKSFRMNLTNLQYEGIKVIADDTEKAHQYFYSRLLKIIQLRAMSQEVQSTS
jgi:hypothetical protein